MLNNKRSQSTQYKTKTIKIGIPLFDMPIVLFGKLLTHHAFVFVTQ